MIALVGTAVTGTGYGSNVNQNGTKAMNGQELKIMLCSRRNPSMTRAQFFEYLETSHASLVKSVPEFLRYLKRYVQNHTRIAGDGVEAKTPFRWATDRDSVIEIWFENKETLLRALSEERYIKEIRPDEAHFNDLTQLIVLATKEKPIFGEKGNLTGQYKTFDYIKKRPDIGHEAFVDAWTQHAAAMTASSRYRALATRSVCNIVVPNKDNPFGIPADYDGVAEVWFDSLKSAIQYEQLRAADQQFTESSSTFIDALKSFSVIAEERPIIAAAK